MHIIIKVLNSQQQRIVTEYSDCITNIMQIWTYTASVKTLTSQNTVC